MAKSMLHACVGMLVAEGALDVEAPAPVVAWSDPDDPRHAITLWNLLTMQPGLAWMEDYEPGSRSDVIDLLFGVERRPQPDVAAWAAAKPLVVPPGTLLNYSSGTSSIVSGIVRDVVGAGPDYEAWLRARLFDPLGMSSATPRFDSVGTWLASSYCFCTAREFASFGQLYLDDGVRDGQRLLTSDWVATARTETGRGDGNPHTAHWWLFGDNPWGAFHCSGYEGQYIVVVPALDLVVVRLGQTKDAEREDVTQTLTDLVASYA
jgi:CubicO group peptidase (beta-lactamase class C family)